MRISVVVETTEDHVMMPIRMLFSGVIAFIWTTLWCVLDLEMASVFGVTAHGVDAVPMSMIILMFGMELHLPMFVMLAHV